MVDPYSQFEKPAPKNPDGFINEKVIQILEMDREIAREQFIDRIISIARRYRMKLTIGE